MGTLANRVLKSTTNVGSSIQAALILLHESSAYSQELDFPIWQFAVEVERLRDAGASNSDLRWLLCKGYAEHGIEITAPCQEGRIFQRTGNLTIVDATCFVLTDDGICLAREIGIAPKGKSSPCETGISFDQEASSKVVWDPDRRILRVGDRIVKQFRVPAANQEMILSVFQEEKWPPRIDDPLPQNGDVHPKRRLHAAVNSLNRNQKNPLIRFHGDGNGSGICWQIVLHND